MSDLHQINILRLEVVGARAELRTARQDLARMKRAVARTAVLHSRTAKEREQELDRVVHEDVRVMDLEDLVLDLQHQEDLKIAHLENAHRPVQQEQWFIRQQLSDALIEFATSVAQSPVAHISLAAASSIGERSAYLGTSDYIEERELDE